MLRPEICVIGAGAGGLAAAAAAAAMGAPVVLIGDAGTARTSIDGGALPLQALIAAAGHAHAVRDGARFGVKVARSGVDFAAVRAHVDAALAAVAPQTSPERFAGLGVRVVAGTARFKDHRTVVAGDTTVEARRFIIATGSVPAVPDIAGLSDVPYLTSETILDLAECPRHLIVLGAGSTGLELAQAFRRLGAEVTVLEAATPLAGDDPECAAVVLDALAAEGVTLRTGVTVARVRRVLARIAVDIRTAAGEATIEGSHLLVATGRRPNLDDLDLDAAGVRYGPRGIAVDRRLCTTNKNVYAVGDVAGGPRSAHLAGHQAGLVVRQALFRVPVGLDYRTVPAVTFTDPELAQVGFLEDEARAHAGAIRVLRWPYGENDRAQATAATSGHIKIITDRRGTVLGATIVGAAAAENITAWTLAIAEKLDIRAFAGLIVPHPTFAEVGKRAAITYFMRGLTSTRVRRIMGWLRRLG